MTAEKNYIGVRVKPETLKVFNSITTEAGINKSYLLRSWINSYIQKQKNNSTELMQEVG